MISAGRALLLVGVVGCGDGGGFPDAAPLTGTFAASWTVTDANTSLRIACDQVGAVSLRVTVKDFQGQVADVDLFNCADVTGTSHGLVPGNYTADYELDGDTGLLVTAPSSAPFPISIGQTTQLPPVTFVIDASGAMSLSASAGTSGGNCAATSANGAGITGTTIVLQHISSTCAPVTFMIGADATRPSSMYTVDCAMPMVAPCIESDQAITVSSVVSGHYTISVRGKVGAASCWTYDAPLTVPPLGRTVMQTLGLGYATGTPGC